MSDFFPCLQTFVIVILRSIKKILKMKKCIFLVGIVISLISMSVYADKTTTRADVHHWGQSSIKGGLERSPVHMPSINVIYESDDNTLQIVSSVDCDATVCVYDVCGNTVDTAYSLNTLLFLPETGDSMFHIRIESANWYATADINAQPK